jgi:hypothetical protein
MASISLIGVDGWFWTVLQRCPFHESRLMLDDEALEALSKIPVLDSGNISREEGGLINLLSLEGDLALPPLTRQVK